MKTDILSEFKSEFKNYGGSNFHLITMYRILFDLMPKRDLTETLEHWKNHYFDYKSSWFTDFHKSMRQTDFFPHMKGISFINNLTSEQEERQSFLFKKRLREAREHCPNHSEEEYEILNELPSRKEDLLELSKLNGIERTKNMFHLNGTLDSLLWNLIQLDFDNDLETILERVFKICV